MNLKEVKHRILSVKSTQKITSAMKLVSSAKLRRAQVAIENMRPYQQKLHEMLFALLQNVQSDAGDYTTVREVRKVAIVAVSSDTGLCGSFNANVARLMSETVAEYKAMGAEVQVYTVGKKMYDSVMKLGIRPLTQLMEQTGPVNYNVVAETAFSLMQQFKAGGVDKVDLIFTRFESMSRHLPVREPLLPLIINAESATDLPDNFILEPGRVELLNALLPRTIALHLYTVLLDSIAAEHAARMIAMQLATDNADELISTLTLEYNKGRQQAITSEILDIVSGSAHEE